MINGVFWRTRCGLPWRDVPPNYGHWKTVYNRHRRWSADGTWERLLDELRRDADVVEGGSGRSGSTPEWSAPTSTPPVPATSPPLTSPRRSSRPSKWTQGAGSNHKKSAAKPSREALGRSRGGLTSKIHLAADTRCRPISRVTTAGHRHDSLAFEPVMAGIRIRRRGPGRPRTRPGHVLGDKAYSSRGIRSHLRRRRITATIPEPADQVSNRLRRGRQRRPSTRVRRRELQAAQRGRAGDQQAQGPPCGSHPLRQTRLRVPRNRRCRLDQDLATRSRSMIRGTRSSRVRRPPRWRGQRAHQSRARTPPHGHRPNARRMAAHRPRP